MIDLTSLDLSKLKPGKTGRQSDAGCGKLTVKRIIPLVIVTEDGVADELALDPVALANGELEAHPHYMICARDERGVFHLTDKDSAGNVVVDHAHAALEGFAGKAVGELSELLGDKAPEVAAKLLANALGLK